MHNIIVHHVFMFEPSFMCVIALFFFVKRRVTTPDPMLVDTGITGVTRERGEAGRGMVGQGRACNKVSQVQAITIRTQVGDGEVVLECKDQEQILRLTAQTAAGINHEA